MLVDPRNILNTLQTAVTALKVDESTNLFDEVKVYDFEDLGKAIEELFLFKHRIAVLLLEDAPHESNILGRVLFVRRIVNLTILLADRNWSNRQVAMMGNEETPGAIQLAHLLVEGLAGEQSGGIIVAPGQGDLMAIERNNAPGRIAWRQEFRVAAGTTKRNLSRNAD